MAIKATRAAFVRIATVMSALVLALVLGGWSAAAQAEIYPGNTTDQPYDFNFDLYVGDPSGIYEKCNTSSIFFGVNTMGGVDYFQIQAQGSTTSDGIFYDYTHNGPVYVYGTGYWRLCNWVYENTYSVYGHSWCRIGGVKVSSGGHVYGIWSPDSTVEYSYINP